MFQLREADSLVHVLRNRGRYVTFTGQQTAGLLGGGRRLLRYGEEFLQLTFHSLHRTFVFLVHVAAQGRTADIHLARHLVLADFVRFHVLLHSPDHGLIIDLLHLRNLLAV